MIQTSFDISEKDLAVFGILLGAKEPLSVTALNQRLHVPKSTLYDSLDRLVHVGVVESNEANYGKTFSALPPNALEHVLQSKVAKAEQALETFADSKDTLEKLFHSKVAAPRFHYSEGFDGMLYGYYSSLQSKEKLLRFVFPENKMFETLGKKMLNDYHQKRLRKNIHARVLAGKANIHSESFLVTSKVAKREVKLLPKNTEFSSSIIIFDDTVNFFTLSGFIISARIQNTEFSQTMKTLFDSVWDSQKVT